MFCQAGFDQWQMTIMHHLSSLSKPQATVLALWSLGMVLARSCALSAVSHWLATGMQRKEQTVRQQLREWYYEAQRKRGAKRQALRVETCFPLLLGWVVSLWQGTQLALAIDATALGDRFVVLAVSVVYRGCAIPVAWVVLPANTKHAWRREWLRLLRRLRPALPRHWQVIVLADRGLYAPWLFRRIVKLGGHPFLRINTGGTFRPAQARTFQPLQTFVPQPGTRWRGRGTAFQQAGRQLECPLWARWEEGYKDPWLILTDLPPEASDAAWYGLRAWIEQGFKITKRAGWQWHRTRMRDPERAARLWLAVAVATLWLLSVGAAADETIPASTLLDVTALCPSRPRTRRATRLRLVSVLRQGWVALLVALLRQEPLPQGRFVPEPWPAVPTWEAEAPEPQLTLPKAA
jgi:DDE family transposase